MSSTVRTTAVRIWPQCCGSSRCLPRCAAGVSGQILAARTRPTTGAFVGTAIRHRAWFRVTARMTATVTAAITSIGPDAWQTIEYPRAVFDEDEQRWISPAEVAEVPFVAFIGRRKAEHVNLPTLRAAGEAAPTTRERRHRAG